ncbi:hypothetical protein D3C78_1213940 [compost metagenome]
MVFHAVTNNLQVFLKIQFKDAQRIAGVFDWCGNRHQWQNDVTFFDVVFNPLGMNTDIPFHKVEARIANETANCIGTNIQAIHFKIVVLQ